MSNIRLISKTQLKLISGGQDESEVEVVVAAVEGSPVADIIPEPVVVLAPISVPAPVPAPDKWWRED